MSQPYVGEIRMFAGNFAPAGWMFCEGQLLPISEYETLFNLIGTTYGGDGQSTFALPDLQSRVPVHAGNGFSQAQTGGTETVTLSTAQIPAHSHSVQVAGPGNANTPAGNVVLSSQGEGSGKTAPAYAAVNAATQLALAPQTIAPDGGSQPHDNMIPYLAVNFILSLFGVFPSQN